MTAKRQRPVCLRQPLGWEILGYLFLDQTKQEDEMGRGGEGRGARRRAGEGAKVSVFLCSYRKFPISSFWGLRVGFTWSLYLNFAKEKMNIWRVAITKRQAIRKAEKQKAAYQKTLTFLALKLYAKPFGRKKRRYSDYVHFLGTLIFDW